MLLLNDLCKYFPHRYNTENPSVQLCFTPSQFGTVYENTKQISESLTRTERQRRMIRVSESHLQLQSKRYEIKSNRDTAQER